MNELIYYIFLFIKKIKGFNEDFIKIDKNIRKIFFGFNKTN